MTAAQRATLTWLHNGEWSKLVAADVVDALRAALGTCGNCEHANPLESHDGMVFCAAPVGEPSRFPLRYRGMPAGERCTGWTAKEGA